MFQDGDVGVGVFVADSGLTAKRSVDTS